MMFWLRVECPLCKASPGELCITNLGGQRAVNPHTQRLDEGMTQVRPEYDIPLKLDGTEGKMQGF